MSAPWIAAFAALWFLVLLLGFAVIGVMRRITGVLERAEQQLATELGGGVPLLTAVPAFGLVDQAGEPVSSDDLIRETSIVLFVDAGCRPCRSIARELSGARIRGIPLVVVAGEEGVGEDFGLSPDVSVYRPVLTAAVNRSVEASSRTSAMTRA